MVVQAAAPPRQPEAWCRITVTVAGIPAPVVVEDGVIDVAATMARAAERSADAIVRRIAEAELES